jgi:hypothetical protein
MTAIVSFPTRPDGSVPIPAANAAALGAELLPLRGNHVRICYSQARRIVEARGGVMLPFGLESEEAVSEIAREASKIPPKVCKGTLMLTCGSGVTLAGILRGLPAAPERVVALSSGRSVGAIEKCVERFAGPMPRSVEIVPAEVPYYAEATTECPFPSHPNYDRKAWGLLVSSISALKGPILFWNIGA